MTAATAANTMRCKLRAILVSMKKLFLHLGFHKTASTSIQKSLAKNRDRLLDLNINYPIFSSKYAKPHLKSIANHSLPVYSAFCENQEDYHLNKRFNIQATDKSKSGFIAQLMAELEKEYDLFLSGEGISLLPNDNLKNFTNIITEYQYEIIPFAFVRSPYSYACSVIQQRIKGGSYLPLLQSCRSIASGTKPFKPPKVGKNLERLIDFFGNSFMAYSFEKAIQDPMGPTGYMMSRLGIGKSEDFEIIRANDGLGNKCTRAMNIDNRIFPQNRNLTHGKRKGLPIDHKFSDDIKFLLTEREFKLISQEIHDENKIISRLLKDEYIKHDTNFSEPLTASDWQRIYEESLLVLSCTSKEYLEIKNFISA